MNWHLVWLWFWFFMGSFMFWLKRAYYGITPPNPVATGYLHYIERAWAPLLIRFFADSIAFWVLFTPALAAKGLAALGWTNWAWAFALVTQFAPVSAAFGFVVDSGMDTLFSKTPGLKDGLPQMPGPMASENVNVTDQKIAEAKQNVDTAADKLKDVEVAPNPPDRRG